MSRDNCIFFVSTHSVISVRYPFIFSILLKLSNSNLVALFCFLSKLMIFWSSYIKVYLLNPLRIYQMTEFVYPFVFLSAIYAIFNIDFSYGNY